MNRRFAPKVLLLSLFALLALFTGCTGQPAPSDAPLYQPPLFRITSPAGHMSYLFGTIHVGTPDFYPLPDFVMDALYSVDYLASELGSAAGTGYIMQ